jgi:hypothetical protein
MKRMLAAALLLITPAPSFAHGMSPHDNGPPDWNWCYNPRPQFFMNGGHGGSGLQWDPCFAHTPVGLR